MNESVLQNVFFWTLLRQMYFLKEYTFYNKIDKTPKLQIKNLNMPCKEDADSNDVLFWSKCWCVLLVA